MKLKYMLPLLVALAVPLMSQITVTVPRHPVGTAPPLPPGTPQVRISSPKLQKSELMPEDSLLLLILKTISTTTLEPLLTKVP
jgi:hypothetical protein